MSDILIKGMELPTQESVTISIYPDGSTGIWTEEGIMAGGEAIAVPPHGRLIQEDGLADNYYTKYLLELCPTISKEKANELLSAIRVATKIADTIIEANN